MRELIEHPGQGNGYRPMLAAVIEALEDGLVEQPWHRRADTVDVARTMDVILAELSRRSPRRSG